MAREILDLTLFESGVHALPASRSDSMFNQFNELRTPTSSLAIDVFCFLAITNSGGGGRYAALKAKSPPHISLIIKWMRKSPPSKLRVFSRLRNFDRGGGAILVFRRQKYGSSLAPRCAPRPFPFLHRSPVTDPQSTFVSRHYGV
jgi:hypothetical protein